METRLRVLHFSSDDDTSGYFPQLAKWHDRDRYHMFFGTLRPIAPWLRDTMRAQGVSCFSLDCTTRATYPLALVRLALLLRRERIGILHTHLFEPSVVGLLAGRLAGTPWLIETRHYSDYHTRIHKRWHVALDRLCTSLSDRVIAVSEHTADHLMEVEGARPDKVVSIVNGIDFERTRISSPAAVRQLRAEMAPHGEPLLLTVGRMHPEKGYEYLLAGLDALRQRLGAFRVVIAGTGPKLDHYRQLARQCRCDDIVTFVGYRRDIANLMAAADLLVLPSVAEAFGLVLAEALYLGTPVVATRVGGIPEIVADGVDGILVPPADTAALIEAIAGLLADPDKLQRMRAAGRARMLERFSFETMMARYEQQYERFYPDARRPVGAAYASTMRAMTERSSN
jgi:glycosyltransferase involved in cell wall biosynthesis